MKTNKLLFIACASTLLGCFAANAAGLPDVEERNAIKVMQVQSEQNAHGLNNYQDNPTLNLLGKIDFLQQEVQDLRGRLEEQSYKLDQMHARQKELYLDLDKRLRAKGPNQVGGVSTMSLSQIKESTQGNMQGGTDQRVSAGVKNLEPTQPTTLDVQDAPLSEADKTAERQVYTAAFKSIQAKDFEKAEMQLRSLLKTFPNGNYVPNAHYWLGELYLVQGSLDLAQTQFETVFQNYPSHQKASDALLKLGYVQYGKGQWQKSSELLGKVKTQFPNSTSARLADTRLEKMRQEGRI